MKRKLLIAVFDVIGIILSFGLALWFRFDLQLQEIPENYGIGYLYFCGSVYCCNVACVLCFQTLPKYMDVCGNNGSYTDIFSDNAVNYINSDHYSHCF